MALIQRCICGSTDFQNYKKNRINLRACKCGISHQVVDMNEEEYANFYKKDYHEGHQSSIGAVPYSERYDHDRHVAQLRFNKYDFHIPARGKILDVGSGNGAFVDFARDCLGYDAYGVDFCDHPWTYKGPLESVNFPTEFFDAITIHDVLEHMVDPLATLKEIKRILKPGGKLIVDFPDYYSEAGKHHWRPVQHLWYMTPERLKEVLASVGFVVTVKDYPIPGKFVLYAYNKETAASGTKILVLPGMGDIYWTLVKLEDFLKKKKIVLPQVYIWNMDGRPRSLAFLERFPFIKAMGYWGGGQLSNKDAAVLYDTYNHYGKWQVPNFHDFDYYISMNGLLTDGLSMDKAITQYESNWYPTMFESIEEINYEKKYKKELGNYIFGFFSSLGMFGHWIKFMPAHVIYKMCQHINNSTGCKIVLSGCEWDREFNNQLMSLDEDGIFIDMVGKTDIDKLYGLMKASKGIVGWCGGNTIMGTVFKKKTIMFWCKKQFPKNFKDVVCPPDSLGQWYRPINVEDYNHEKVASLVSKMFPSYMKTEVNTDGDKRAYSSRNRRRILDPNEAHF